MQMCGCCTHCQIDAERSRKVEINLLTYADLAVQLDLAIFALYHPISLRLEKLLSLKQLMPGGHDTH